jgi:hypothetical protein
MTSSAMSSPLRIELRPAPALKLCLVLLAVLAGASVWLSAAPAWVSALPPLLLLASWPRRPADAPVALVLRSDGTLAWIDREAREHEATAERLQTRGPLTVLSLRRGARRCTHVFTPDTLAAQTRRQLALWFERHVSSPDSPSPVAHV